MEADHGDEPRVIPGRRGQRSHGPGIGPASGKLPGSGPVKSRRSLDVATGLLTRLERIAVPSAHGRGASTETISRGARSDRSLTRHDAGPFQMTSGEPGSFNSRRTMRPVLERTAIGQSQAPKSGTKTPIDRFQSRLAPRIPFRPSAGSLHRSPVLPESRRVSGELNLPVWRALCDRPATRGGYNVRVTAGGT